ncbi:MAG: hypothetical protein A2Y25_10315 [Candidatus Melainabacteria bacterium GWF2_37_15]|nr:MAG: hypothetical protein A2Y25_10315 [Candidatus Melainabacteria bacterium GWF2_37_15]
MNGKSDLQSKFTQLIVSSSDPEELKNMLAKEIAIELAVYRCFFIEYDPSTNKFKKVINSYNTQKDAPSMLEYDIESDMPDLALKLKYMKSVVTQDIKNAETFLAVRLEFGENFLGVVVLHYDEKNPPMLDFDLRFLMGIADYISIALYLSSLYAKEKAERESAELLKSIVSAIADRERLIREVTLTIRNTQDIIKIKNYVVNRLGEIFKADRCLIRDYDPKKNYFWPPDPEAEYRSSNDVKSMTNFCLLSETNILFRDLMRNENILVVGNTDDFIRKNELKGTIVENLIEEFSIKSGIFQLVINFMGETIGLFALHYTKDKITFSQEDIGFIKTIIDQVGIAIYQIKLFEKTKQTAQRERLIREVITTIRSTLDPYEMRGRIVNAVGKAFNADRCYIRIFDKKAGIFLLPDIEYLSSPSIKSILTAPVNQEGMRFFYLQVQKTKKYTPIIVNQEFLAEKGLQNSPLAGYLQQAGIKTDVAIPMWDKEDELSFLVLHFLENVSSFPEESIQLMKTLGEQVIIGINQAKFYENVKESVEREKLIRQIIEAIRSTLDKNEIKKTFVTAIGTYLKVDRVDFSEYDPISQKFLPTDENSEYLASPNVTSLACYDWSEKEAECYVNIMKSKVEMNIPDIDKYEWENTPECYETLNWFKKIGIRSTYNIPILYGNEIMGFFCIDYTEKQYKIKNEELEFIRTLANQAGIALYQAKLFENVNKSAEREKLIRQITEAIRSTLDVEQIKKEIVTAIGKSLNAQRVFIVELDEIQNKFLPVTQEFLASGKLKSSIGHDPQKEVPEIISRVRLNPVIIENAEQFLTENNMQHTLFEKHLREYEVKSAFSMPLFYADKLLGYLVIHYTERVEAFSKDEIDFVKSLADQTAIAFHQSKLYETVKKSVEREKLLRDLIQTLRTSIDINETKKLLVDKIGTALNADRVFFVEFDPEKNKPLVLDKYSEYLSSPDLVSYVGFDFSGPQVEFLSKEHQQKKLILVKDIEDFIKVNNLQNTPTEQWLREAELKTGIGVTIFYGEKVYGVLAIHFTKNKVPITDEQVEFLKTLGDQVGIAYYQAKLFETLKKTAEKEKLLREIVSGIKVSPSLEDAYNYILIRLTEIFEVDRSVFFELTQFMHEKPYIKYEYLKNKNLPSVKYLGIPQVCLDTFLFIKEERIPFAINNAEEYYAGKDDALEFFEKYQIKSMLSVPLIRYNREVRGLGFISLCSSIPREWKKEEIDLMQDIAGTVVNVVWDISKLVEIEQIRNTFMLTLAHDFLVPVIGERKALEYLNSKPEDTPIREIKPIINGLLDNNQALNESLTKLIDISNYEMGRKKLEYSEQEMKKLIDDVYKSLQYLAESKSIKVDFRIEGEIPLILVDKQEISKVLAIVLKNALEYAPHKGNVTIAVRISKNKYVSTCITDNGPGFPPEIKELIFKRYEMIQVLGRKIGAGLSLYLAKLIVQAHSGLIEIESKVGQGTTFCMYLPVEREGR